ncbi:MAG: hypothetical protein ACM3UR_10470 [Bacteroidota bacterium]
MEGIILVSPLLFLMVTIVSSKTTHGNCFKAAAVSVLYPAYPEFLLNLPAPSVLPLRPGSVINEKSVTGIFRASFGPERNGKAFFVF